MKTIEDIFYELNKYTFKPYYTFRPKVAKQRITTYKK